MEKILVEKSDHGRLCLAVDRCENGDARQSAALISMPATAVVISSLEHLFD
jgi:hypothetical protein